MTLVLSCPHCGFSVSAQDKFCANCGKELLSTVPGRESSPEKPATVVCQTCGRVNAVTNEVCYGCGSPLAVSPTVGEQSKKTVPQSKHQSKKHTEPASPTKYVLIIFLIVAVLIIVLEYRNSPKGSSLLQNAVSPQQQSQQTDPAVLQEITQLESRIKINPKESEALLELANKLHDAKFYPRAIETYKQFLVMQPNNSDARVDLGICYFEIGEIQQAVNEIESVIKKNPNHQMASFNLGVIQLSSGNLPEAKKWLKKAAEIDPSSPAGQRAQELLQQH
jgi:TolA-binding protein/RNA polymerase subunit RPABC4/transcription elongation factor Spt4